MTAVWITGIVVFGLVGGFVAHVLHSGEIREEMNKFGGGS